MASVHVRDLHRLSLSKWLILGGFIGMGASYFLPHSNIAIFRLSLFALIIGFLMYFWKPLKRFFRKITR